MNQSVMFLKTSSQPAARGGEALLSASLMSNWGAICTPTSKNTHFFRSYLILIDHRSEYIPAFGMSLGRTERQQVDPVLPASRGG